MRAFQKDMTVTFSDPNALVVPAKVAYTVSCGFFEASVWAERECVHLDTVHDIIETRAKA